MSSLFSRLAKLEEQTADAHQRETEEEIRARLAAVPDAVLFAGREPLESLVRRLDVYAYTQGSELHPTPLGRALLDARGTNPGDDDA
jgi:hypothetical protein